MTNRGDNSISLSCCLCGDRTFSIPAQSANSEPLSTVIVRKILLKFAPYSRSRLSRTRTTLRAVWSRIGRMISRLDFLSVRTRSVFFVFFLPSTQSISQSPTTARSSISFGRFSILVPAGGRFALLTLLYGRFFWPLTGRFLFVTVKKTPLSI